MLKTSRRPRSPAAPPGARKVRPAGGSSGSAMPDASAELDEVFAIVARYFGLLSEPTRLKILHSICQDERSVSAIVASTGVVLLIGHVIPDMKKEANSQGSEMGNCDGLE